ncbi:hypothetical protein BV898_09082 [Hypsibius exemplaris]|uniref:SUEL-type lectin domain-containing protein n=1 Tax=Hypsibius exemplaris TaxID=2072580 RepID=A0A1W0WNC9_HYPEX|nr:hypothetical protein BV898_09082 [Hypsibius exemplaris]
MGVASGWWSASWLCVAVALSAIRLSVETGEQTTFLEPDPGSKTKLRCPLQNNATLRIMGAKIYLSSANLVDLDPRTVDECGLLADMKRLCFGRRSCLLKREQDKELEDCNERRVVIYFRCDGNGQDSMFRAVKGRYRGF